jgi:hypothetical protein
VNVSADQAASNARAAHGREKKQSKESAVSFLEDVLANGPVLKRIIDERAAKRFSPDQLDRAKKKLGVIAEKKKGVEVSSLEGFGSRLAIDYQQGKLGGSIVSKKELSRQSDKCSVIAGRQIFLLDGKDRARFNFDVANGRRALRRNVRRLCR